MHPHAYHHVLSLPVAPHQNKPPEIHFSTSPNVTIRLPDDTYLLDASQSSDDDEDHPLRYQWELVSKPVGAPAIEPSNTAALSLEKLQEGVYEFKLVSEPAMILVCFAPCVALSE